MKGKKEMKEIFAFQNKVIQKQTTVQNLTLDQENSLVSKDKVFF